MYEERRGVSRRTFGRQVVARERQGLSGLRRCCCKGCIEGIGRRGVVCWVREELKLEKNYDEWHQYRVYVGRFFSCDVYK